MFAQRHTPGERAQSDFTHMEDLGVTIAGEPFPHMVFHLVLTYSNVEAARICFSESFEALAEGIEYGLWQIGGVPEQHRTDHLTAAVKQESKTGTEDWTKRYQALMEHYGMQPTWNNTGIAHENGDVEQAHRRFKEAVDQALRVRGTRDWSTSAIRPEPPSLPSKKRPCAHFPPPRLLLVRKYGYGSVGFLRLRCKAMSIPCHRG